MIRYRPPVSKKFSFFDEFAQVKHHKQKIVFIFSSMRHFCKSLRNDGLKVYYVGLEDEKNTGCLTSELSRAVKKYKIGKLIVTEPSEWHALELVKTWAKKLGVVVEIRKDDRFLCSKDEFKEWSKEKKVLRMENFYRHMRKKTGWLMDGQKPLGGKWNYDTQNRKSLPQKVIVPECKRFKPDDITRGIMSLVDERFKDHFGNLQNYRWAVTRRDAQKLCDFIMR